MWKYLLRRFRETVERSVNCFDKRTSNGIVNSISGNVQEENTQSGPPCHWFSSKTCGKSFREDSGANSKKWNHKNLNQSCAWLGAITWSGVLVMGWYATQLTYLKSKYHTKQYKEKCSSGNNLLSILHPYVSCVNKNPTYLDSPSKIKSVIKHLVPTVHLMSNEKHDIKQESTSSNSYSDDPSVKDFKDMLNVIENKLALSAIENGQPKDGLKLLKSAAHRNYAPALYNLGVCYEKGIGVHVNEKMAMEFYRSASALEHPGALYNLGIYYGQGRGGLTRDSETATRLLRLAAVQGHENAINVLKSLDDDTPDTKSNDMDMWNFNYSSLVRNGQIMPPTHTTLFVENVNYLHSPNQQLAF
ncbi:uncharacterized protein ACR2FA_004685 [Aphomia sociella]